MKKNKKILILVNYLSFFVSHRLPVAEALLDDGIDVFIGYGDHGGANPKLLQERGFKVNYIPMQPGGINLYKELNTIFNIWKFLNRVKPDIIHTVTVKPNLYGGIISRLIGVPALVSAVSGLGTLFIGNDFKNKFLKFFLYPIYKLAFSHINQKVIFQNQDDLKVLLDWGVLDSAKVKLVKGSGVNLENFKDFTEPKGIPVVCFTARLLRDKGVYEFINAARILKERKIIARFCLAGDLDTNNPSGLKIEDLKKIKDESLVEILGFVKNISKLYSASNIVCLPSYREGLPKSLIEAAAASRAIVTTDVPGCRDAIIPNKTGLLVPVKNSLKLADAIQWLIEHPEERTKMGKAGRLYAEKEFPIEKIVQSHLDIYQELLN